MQIKIVKNLDAFIPIFSTSDSIIIPIIEKYELILLFVCIDDILYVLNFGHDDLYYKVHDISKLLESNTNKFIHNKYRLDKLIKLKNTFEIRLFYYLSTNTIPKEILNVGRTHYDKLYGKLNNNYIMPFTVLTDYAIKIIQFHYDYVKNNVRLIETKPFKAYNSVYLRLSDFIKTGGIYANNTYYNLDYNFFTTTGRPILNNNKQFLSLQKDSEIKKSIKSRFNDGRLIYFDYKASHMYILADIIGFTFPEDPYTYFAKILLDKNDITADDRDAVKTILFSVLYRKTIPYELLKLEFFYKVNKFIEKIYNEINEQGYFNTHFFNKKIYAESLSKKDKNISFNYYILSYETERNVILLNKIIDYIEKNKLKTKIILYIYDGFLFDYSKSDGSKIIQFIYNALKNNKYRLTVEYGDNFNNLKKVNIY